MSYWPQQLNFAVWCTTIGCGISREVLNKVLEQIKLSLEFHIYLTVRRTLFEMGGVRVNQLFQVTQLSARYIVIMTRHRSNKYAKNLEFHLTRTSASKKVLIMVSDLFSLCDKCWSGSRSVNNLSRKKKVQR